VVRCEKCGAEWPDDTLYCDKCGQKFGSQEDTLIFKGLGDQINEALKEKGRIHKIEVDFENSIGIQFKKIAPGNFVMGSEEWDDTKPVRKVTISKPFYMGIYPVTQKEWSRIMKKNPSRFTGDDRPVECVSWKDCQMFCVKLGNKEGKKKYRLPTEAEWEYCCRADTDTIYSCGDDTSKLMDHAWFYDNAKDDGTHPVGTKLPNPWGLSDMHGNVWEWVREWYGPYSGKDEIDPMGPPKGSAKVHRGGSWCNDSILCSTVFRRFNNPDRRRHNLGFRIVMVKK